MNGTIGMKVTFLFRDAVRHDRTIMILIYLSQPHHCIRGVLRHCENARLSGIVKMLDCT